ERRGPGSRTHSRRPRGCSQPARRILAAGGTGGRVGRIAAFLARPTDPQLWARAFAFLFPLRAHVARVFALSIQPMQLQPAEAAARKRRRLRGLAADSATRILAPSFRQTPLLPVVR